MQLPKLNTIAHTFHPSHFGVPADVRGDLQQQEGSVAILVTCSELGFEPDLLSGAKRGGLTIIQLAGGLVIAPGQKPHVGDAFGDRISDPKIRHLIFCGHSHCKIFERLLADHEGHKKLLIYPFMEPALERLKNAYPHRPLSERLGIIIQESVLNQAGLVQNRPDVSARLEGGSLRLHIWVRDDDSAKLAVYDPVGGQFNFK